MTPIESTTVPSSQKPHAVFIPFPLQGHITPQMKLAQLFHQKGFYVTFVNTEFNQKQSCKSKNNSFSDLTDFDFQTFDDSLVDAQRVEHVNMCLASRACFADRLRDLVVQINADDKSPPVSCIISDCMMPYNIDTAKQLGVPCFMSPAMSAVAYLVFRYHHLLKEKGVVPVTEETHETSIDFIPGIKNLRGKDIPFTPGYKIDAPMKEFAESIKSSGIILNTFESIDQEVLNAIQQDIPNVYPIGPLHLLQNWAFNGKTKPLQFNLWEEHDDCLEWLDTMKPNSVLYISFGSLALIPNEKLIELAWGILDSDHPFLWIMRPNPGEKEITLFPSDLMTKIREKGFVAPWSSQEKVLDHPSIGGFLTHCGWNSAVESIAAGVPMICWPQFGNHSIVSGYICKNWGVGIKMGAKMYADVKRDEVTKLVKDLMEGECGKELKKKSMEWKKLAHEATQTQGGSSCLSLEKLFKDAGYFPSKKNF